jgi:hypothetical protein
MTQEQPTRTDHLKNIIINPLFQIFASTVVIFVAISFSEKEVTWQDLLATPFGLTIARVITSTLCLALSNKVSPKKAPIRTVVG